MSAVGSATHDDDAAQTEDGSVKDHYLTEILRMADKAEDLLERFKYRYPEIQERFERLRSSKTPEEENADDILDRFKRRYPELRGSPNLSDVMRRRDQQEPPRLGRPRDDDNMSAESAPVELPTQTRNRMRSDSLATSQRSSNLNMAGALLAKYSESVENGDSVVGPSEASSASHKSSGTGTAKAKKTRTSREGSKQRSRHSSRTNQREQRSSSQSRSRSRRRSTSDISLLRRVARSSSVPPPHSRPRASRSSRSRHRSKRTSSRRFSSTTTDQGEADRINEQTELYKVRMKRLKNKYEEIVTETKKERKSLNTSKMFEDAKNKFEMERAARELAKAEADRDNRKRSERKKRKKGRRGNFDVVAKPLKIGGGKGYMKHFDKRRWQRNQKKTQCILEDLRCTYPDIARELECKRGRTCNEGCANERDERSARSKKGKRSKRPPSNHSVDLEGAEHEYHRAKYKHKKVKRRAIEEPSFLHPREYKDDYSAEKAKNVLAIQDQLVKMRNHYPEYAQSELPTVPGVPSPTQAPSRASPRPAPSVMTGEGSIAPTSKSKKSRKSKTKSKKKSRSLPTPSDANYTVTGFAADDLRDRYLKKRFVSAITTTTAVSGMGSSLSSEPPPASMIPPIPEAPATQTPGHGPITQTPGGSNNQATAYRTPGGPGESEAGAQSDWSLGKFPITVLKQLYFEKPTPGGPTMYAGTATEMDGMTAVTGPTAWTTPGGPDDGTTVAPSEMRSQARTTSSSVDLRPGAQSVNKEELARLTAMNIDQLKQQYFQKPEAWNDTSTLAPTRTGDMASTAPPRSQMQRNGDDGATAATSRFVQTPNGFVHTPGGEVSMAPTSPTSVAPTSTWPYAEVFRHQQSQRPGAPHQDNRRALTQDMAAVEEVKGGRKHGFTSLMEQDSAYPTPPLKASQPPTLLRAPLDGRQQYPLRRTIASISEFSYQPQIPRSASIQNIPQAPAKFQRMKYSLPQMSDQGGSTMNSGPPMPPIPFRGYAGNKQAPVLMNRDQANFKKFRQSQQQYKSESTTQRTPPQSGASRPQPSPSAASSQWRNLGGYNRIVSTPPPSIPPMPLGAQIRTGKHRTLILAQPPAPTAPSSYQQFPLSDRTDQYRNQGTEASSSVSSRMRPKSGLSSNGSGPLFVRKGRHSQENYQDAVTLGRVAESMQQRDYLDTYSEQTDNTSNAQVIETSV